MPIVETKFQFIKDFKVEYLVTSPVRSVDF